jgi:hypothetical protein
VNERSAPSCRRAALVRLAGAATAGLALALAGCEQSTNGPGDATAGGTPTTPGVGGQSGTGDPRTTGDQSGYAQATSVAAGGTGGTVSQSQNRGLTAGGAGATPATVPSVTGGR